jgi:hypothetical protein
LHPVSGAAHGNPHAFAWNIGTIGSATERTDRLNTSGATSAMAWSIAERCSYKTPLGFPVVPLV